MYVCRLCLTGQAHCERANTVPGPKQLPTGNIYVKFIDGIPDHLQSMPSERREKALRVIKHTTDQAYSCSLGARPYILLSLAPRGRINTLLYAAYTMLGEVRSDIYVGPGSLTEANAIHYVCYSAAHAAATTSVVTSCQ